MKHIPKVLYIYRITGENTWIQRNKEIQTGTWELFYQNAVRLAERDADLQGLMKVDLGGGIAPKEGYTTIDRHDGDITADLGKTWPLANNSVGVLRASHVLEHLKKPLFSLAPIHRVLADGGWAFIDVPSTDGRGAWQDPTHVSFWNQNSFWYYTRKDQAQYIRNTKIRFQEWRLNTGFPGPWWRENNIPVTTAWLTAVKSDARRPHLIKI